MINEQSQEVMARFFAYIDNMIENGVINGLSHFARLYDINRGNLNNLRKNGGRTTLQLCWLTYLVRDFYCNPEWLLTGNGEMYKSGFTPETIKKCRCL